jgi:hypothetical protein
MLGAMALCLAAVSPAALAAPAAAPAARPATKTPAQESFDRYQVLLSNNIFVRDRARWNPRGRAAAGSPLTPEEATALRGVVRQGEGANATYYVFLEDVRTQETTKMRVGAPVCAGKLVNPTLDSVDYLKNGVAKRIQVGQNLTGKQAATPAPAQPAGDDNGNAPALQPVVRGTGASPASTAPALSPEKLLEQMRQKRLKELGK